MPSGRSGVTLLVQKDPRRALPIRAAIIEVEVVLRFIAVSQWTEQPQLKDIPLKYVGFSPTVLLTHSMGVSAGHG